MRPAGDWGYDGRMTDAPRGPYAKTAARRASIARAALDIVQERGHRGLTTAEVAQRAGISERAMFYHYPSRDHLLVAALELSDAEANEDAVVAANAAGLAKGGDLFEFIAELLTRQRDTQEWRVPLSVALSAYAQDPEHPAHAYFVQHYDRALGAFEDAFRQRQAMGLATPDIDPVTVARRTLAIWEGLQAQWLVRRDFDLAAELQQSFRQLSGQAVLDVRNAIDAVLAAS